MENFAITLVCIALLIIGAVSVSMSALNSINTVADALKTEESLSRDVVNTSIVCENSSTTGNGSTVALYVLNNDPVHPG